VSLTMFDARLSTHESAVGAETRRANPRGGLPRPTRTPARREAWWPGKATTRQAGTCLVLALALGLAAVAGCTPSGRGEDLASPEGFSAVRIPEGGHDTPYEVLDEALQSSQPPLAAMACETYLEAGRQPPLGRVEPLADTRDPRVRATALALMGTLQRRDLADLFRRKQRDADPTVRLAAAFGLAMTVEPDRMSALRDALGAPDVRLRRMAAWLLGLTGRTSAIGLLEVKLDDPDAVVVLRAAEAMHRLGSGAGHDRVRTLTRHNRHLVRYYATRLLGRMGEKEDIPLLERLCQSRFLDVKFGAIASLAQLGDFKRVGMLLDLLEAPDSETRVLAARELGETGYTPALEPLQKMLASQVPLQRTTAAAAIVRIRSAERPWRSTILKEERENGT